MHTRQIAVCCPRHSVRQSLHYLAEFLRNQQLGAQSNGKQKSCSPAGCSEGSFDQAGGYGKVIASVVIGLKTVRGVKQLKLDPTIYDSLQKERVNAGDVIYIEANSGTHKVHQPSCWATWRRESGQMSGQPCRPLDFKTPVHLLACASVTGPALSQPAWCQRSPQNPWPGRPAISSVSQMQLQDVPFC